MRIENHTIGILIALVVMIIYMKFWRIIAEYIGDKLGIGKFIVSMLERKSKEQDDSVKESDGR